MQGKSPFLAVCVIKNFLRKVI
ncbi:unnamed protein product [Larinioides sclopetarius]|uniref:Uncharacterized protein n=1 Tax=Larinioides sclopetarius TaxID=280406 RepID=A0AAV2BZF8_9ARAC